MTHIPFFREVFDVQSYNMVTVSWLKDEFYSQNHSRFLRDLSVFDHSCQERISADWCPASLPFLNWFKDFSAVVIHSVYLSSAG